MQPDVSVVVVNWNSGGHLARCLAALDDLPVIVMDNGSSDGSDRCVCKPTRLLRNLRNLGYGTAVNQAVNLTKSRFILVLNPDCRVTTGSVETLVAVLNTDDTCAVVGPRVLNDDGTLQGSARGDPDMLTGLFGRSALLRRLFPRIAVARENVRDEDLADTGGGIVDWVAGPCMLIRRQAFDQVTGFDERYFLYWEDADLCRRLRGCGWTIRYVPAATVRHTGRACSRHAPRATAISFHRSAFRYYATHVASCRWDPRRWIALALLSVRCILKVAITR